MGRTLQPYSNLVDNIYERFKKFRKALRKEDQRSFDMLMNAARSQLQVGVMAAQPNPFDSMSMSMLIELHKELLHLQRRLDALEKRQIVEKSDPADSTEGEEESMRSRRAGDGKDEQLSRKEKRNTEY
ncbi:MAG: hypothetical protein KDK25_02860 [Leptospiraceae bacterium]|nr:hypothetical protein [Leptospiraceae bacterium]